MNEEVELHQASYHMYLNGGGDTWGLAGEVVGHPNYEPYTHIMISSPKEFNEEENLITTFSGRKYRIFSFRGNKEETIKQIKDDIENGGYDVH